jgi:hypothetical protein
MTDLETETDGDTTTFEHFGRGWTIPVRRHHSHVKQVKDILRSEGYLDADDIASIYLAPEQYDELVALDVTEFQLGEFATALSQALGLGSPGNSAPSSPSS